MNDAIHFYAAGQQLAQGLSPYSKDFAYPVIVAYFLALLSQLPLIVFCAIFFLTNMLLLLKLARRRASLWAAYAPILLVIISGQWDLLILFLESQLESSRWAPLWAALITLKPQLAFFLLPPHLWRWRKSRTLLAFAGCCLALWGGPLLVYPNWIKDWLGALYLAPSGNSLNTASLWGLGLWLPNGIILLLCFIPLIWMLRCRQWNRACLLLLAPFGGNYSTMILLDGPLALIPISWLPAFLGSYTGWTWVIPAAALLIQTLRSSRGSRSTYARDYSSPRHSPGLLEAPHSER